MKTDSLLAKIEAKSVSVIDQKEGLQLICQLLYDCIETTTGWVLFTSPEKRAGFTRLLWRIDRAYKYSIWKGFVGKLH
ncbi:MAG: hypothetical protein CM15mP83_4160 [Flavobacteriaceae bacterium]|nr:MAG: hypothetical protein CM15mP83_4160 [Flavobacteriaceae bacterium]